MKLLIKGRHFKLTSDLENYADEKFSKLEKLIKDEAAVIDVVLSDRGGSKGGNDKGVDVTAILPGEKNPFHITQNSPDFRASVDLAFERVEKHILRYKEKKLDTSRLPPEALT